MKNQKTRIISEFGNEYKCTRFWCTDLNYGGIDVSRDGEHHGEIVGLDIPDPKDVLEVDNFRDAVIEWVIENEHN